MQWAKNNRKIVQEKEIYTELHLYSIINSRVPGFHLDFLCFRTNSKVLINCNFSGNLLIVSQPILQSVSEDLYNFYFPTQNCWLAKKLFFFFLQSPFPSKELTKFSQLKMALEVRMEKGNLIQRQTNIHEKKKVNQSVFYEIRVRI